MRALHFLGYQVENKGIGDARHDTSTLIALGDWFQRTGQLFLLSPMATLIVE